MDIGSAIDWVVGTPIVVLMISITLWWLLEHKDKGMCSKCNAPKLFGNKCISCGTLSMNSAK